MDIDVVKPSFQLANDILMIKAHQCESKSIQTVIKQEQMGSCGLIITTKF